MMTPQGMTRDGDTTGNDVMMTPQGMTRDDDSAGDDT